MDLSYIDAAEMGHFIRVWARDVKGELTVEDFDTKDYLNCYIPDNTGEETKFKNLYGQPVKRIDFIDKWDLRDFAKSRSDICESDVNPATKLLMDLFSDAPLDAPYNILYYDIEVDFDLEDGHGYPTPKNPFGEINSFQGFDTKRQCYVLFAFEGHDIKLNDAEYPVEIHWVSGERELLECVADYIEHIDILIGWYTQRFDLPYIMERSIMLFGEDHAKRMYCRAGKARRRDFIDPAFKEETTEWSLVGRHHLDMMALYKKFMPGEKESFSLNAVCEADLGMTKVQYDGDLGDLYRENPQMFFEYALHDARLLLMLDKKHQIVRLAMTLARMNCVGATDVAASVHPIETGFIKFCHEKNIVLPDKTHSEREDFPGAIVYDTIAGLHGWAMTVDLTALYPSVMIMLGLSTETLVGQCTGEYDDYVAVMARQDTPITLIVEETGEKVKLKAFELEELIRDAGYTLSANGTLFSGDLGLLSEYVQNRFAMRKAYQKQSKTAFKEGNTEDGTIFDLYQKVMKIVCNSLYGCISNAHFRLYDIRMAKSITLSGRVVSKHQAYMSNQLVESMKEVA